MKNSPSKVPIRWIAFDAVGTLIFANPGVAETYTRIGNRYGADLSTEIVRSRFQNAFAEHQRTFSTSEEHELNFWKRIVGEVLGTVENSDDCFHELYQHFSLPESWRIADHAADVISVLQSEGFGVAIASNFDRRLHTALDGNPILCDIDVRLISSEIGWRKPSLEFYNALVERCQCAPEEILMVGDDFANDYTGARNAGLRAVHLGAERSDIDPEFQIASLADVLPLSRCGL
ncbi:dUMP phosphatase [Thalassoglobus neptunius]|uniref:dUMP phosphatase n=1 Tax=Thalassoglobus neptunius TaxID=1938619 RepID=A0A5C5WIH0_9PLAN|nr:HAD-IA family hydrolase [Thalassoglobus neptunius]TWT49895.1 dUMP phosphatase [Thalassoglobus neptunius]